MKNLIGIEDLSIEEIDDLIELASDIIENRNKYSEKCKGQILATLFFEPSTRTRLSFESAMLSLGGQVLGFSSANSSSASKGESVGDTIKVVSAVSCVHAKALKLPLLKPNHPKRSTYLLLGYGSIFHTSRCSLWAADAYRIVQIKNNHIKYLIFSAYCGIM